MNKFFLATFFLVFMSSANATLIEDIPLAPDNFSCVSGGGIEECFAEVQRMREHEIPQNNYSSAGNFILLNATCVPSKAKFLFHAPYRFTEYFTSIHIDYHQPYSLPEKDEMIGKIIFYRKIGVLRIKTYEGLNKYKDIMNIQFPELVEYLEKVGAFNYIDNYFALTGEEIAQLTELPICLSPKIHLK